MLLHSLEYWPALLIAPAVLIAWLVSRLLLHRRLARLGADAARRIIRRHPGLSLLRQLCIVFSLVFFAIALLRPRWGEQAEPERETGLDLVFAIDVSASMDAEDVPPSRLKRVLTEIDGLLEMLEGNRFALVPFAGGAFVYCPLTADTGALRLFLEGVGSGMIDLQGTDIGAAMQRAAEVLDDRFRRNRIVLLFSDGEDHEGDPVALAEKLSKEKKVTFFTIGVGTTNGAPVPSRGEYGEEKVGESYRRGTDGSMVISSLDEATLREIAEKSGGGYFRIDAGGFPAAELAERLGRLEAERLGTHGKRDLVDRFQVFVLAGLIFLMLGVLVPERREVTCRDA